MNSKVYRSRISVLVTGIAMVILIFPFIQMIRYAYEGLYIFGGTLILIFLFTKVDYMISDGKLYIKLWFIPYGNIDIADIVSVERSYNPISAPAASLKRLRIRFRKGMGYRECLISPDKEQEFLENLKVVNPDIYVNAPDNEGIWRIWDWDI